MTGNHLQITIYPEVDHFTRCYEAAVEVAARLRLSNEQKFRFAVCVSEAYTNAYLHGNRCDPSKCINLSFYWNTRKVWVEIEDEGEGTPDLLRLAESRPDIGTEKSGGRGVGIMKRFADRLEVEERQEGGLRVRIIFRLSGQSTQADVTIHESNGGVHGNQSHRK
jgi:anti-sigma regulatory factor (Ser/Thr protein kinase)